MLEKMFMVKISVGNLRKKLALQIDQLMVLATCVAVHLMF